MNWILLSEAEKARSVLAFHHAESFGAQSRLRHFSKVFVRFQKRIVGTEKDFFKTKKLTGDPVHLWSVEIRRGGRVKPDTLENVSYLILHEAVKEKPSSPVGKYNLVRWVLLHEIVNLAKLDRGLSWINMTHRFIRVEENRDFESRTDLHHLMQAAKDLS
jgi:hypothetical protein